MNVPTTPDGNAYEGVVTAGAATGRPLPPLTEEDLRTLEAAWNDPLAYEFAMNETDCSAGAPRAAVDSAELGSRTQDHRSPTPLLDAAAEVA